MPIPADYMELASAGLDIQRVEAIWAFGASSPGEHIVLPDGRMDLIVRYRLAPDGRVTDMVPAITGPSQKPARVLVARGDCFLGLRYRPGWGGACLGVQPSTLCDTAIRGPAALAVLGQDAEELRQATTPDLLAQALVGVSRQRAARLGRQVPASTLRAIDLLHLAGGRLAPADAARAVDVADRTLRRRVAEATGLSFKALAAVLRFQRTMRLLAACPRPTLAQAALEGGYSDQAHMTREFQRYGGFTPGRRPPVAFGSLPIGQVAESFKIAALASR